MPTKKEFQKLSQQRLESLKVLCRNNMYDIVCKDYGYVPEFGLKASICKTMNRTVYPDNEKKYRTHDLEKLVDLAKLRSDFDNKKSTNIDFFVNWSLLSKWSVNFRYEPIGNNKKENAEEIINALEDENGGVYVWIKENW